MGQIKREQWVAGPHLALKVINTGIGTGKYVTRYCEIPAIYQ